VKEGRIRVWFGLVWFGLVWFGLVWFGLVWFGLVWFSSALAILALSAWSGSILARRPCATKLGKSKLLRER
jgi:hypothetical protein